MPHLLPSFNFHLAPAPPIPIPYPPIPSPNPPAAVDPISIPDPPDAIDIPTAISLLQRLTDIAGSTIRSFSSSLSISPPSLLARCPFDPNHRLPPESLFLHSLRCRSAPGAQLLDLAFLDTLRYPTSINAGSEIPGESTFVLPVSQSDLCFSLDAELGDSGSRFFYKDCPAVVAFPEADDSGKTFNLPSVLLSECANFVVDHEKEVGLNLPEIRILPSEFWALKLEVEKWVDYPVSYSYPALQVVSCLHRADYCHLKQWVIMYSPDYGVVIDAALRDHIFVLLKLCLKAVQKEALSSLALFSTKDKFVERDYLAFECPGLFSSFTWLWSQLSTLYGDSNAKVFAISLLRECILSVGSISMLFKLREKDEGGDNYGDISSEKVYVSQIAAAVAALHERFILEEHIKILRFAPRPLRLQILSEHSYICRRGSEERRKRPNYRAVIEHDGLLMQRGHDQRFYKEKTREELLAEERDYKRRRMSYRGKKVKRTPTQVIHDIIEEHMEIIKEAGGIGSSFTAPEKSCSDDVNVGHHIQHYKNDSSSSRKLLQSTDDVHIGLNGISSGGSRSSLPQKEPQKESKSRHEREKKHTFRSTMRGGSHDQMHEQYLCHEEYGDEQYERYSRYQEHGNKRYSRSRELDSGGYSHHGEHDNDYRKYRADDKNKYHNYSKSRYENKRAISSSRSDKEYPEELDRYTSATSRRGSFSDRYDPRILHGQQ